MDEAEYFIQQLDQISHANPPSTSWPEALPHVKRFAMSPLRPQLAHITWITRMQALAREAIRTSLGTNDQLNQFCSELGQIGLDEGYQCSDGGCGYITRSMWETQGRKESTYQDLGFLTKSMLKVTVKCDSQSKSPRLLPRAIFLFQRMFMAIREETYQWDILHVEERHGILYFVSNGGTRDSNIGSFAFRPLPRDMIKDLTDRNSLLMYSECRKFVVDMMNQIQCFLGDLCQNIEEIDVVVKNVRRPTCQVQYSGTHRNNMDDLHSILRIVTHDGQSFAIDATAAQYGWMEAVVPWDLYLEQRVLLVRRTMPFGSFATHHKDVMAQKDYIGGIHEARNKVSDSVNAVVTDWLKEKSLTPAQLLDLSDAEYVRIDNDLVAAVRDGVKASIGTLRQRGLYRVYSGKPGCLGKVGDFTLTRSEREYKQQKKSWYTAEVYDERMARAALKGEKTGLAGMRRKW